MRATNMLMVLMIVVGIATATPIPWTPTAINTTTTTNLTTTTNATSTDKKTTANIQPTCEEGTVYDEFTRGCQSCSICETHPATPLCAKCPTPTDPSTTTCTTPTIDAPATLDDLVCNQHTRPMYKAYDRTGKPVCVACKHCGLGYGVVSQCTETTDTVCAPCDGSMWFSESISVWEGCKMCIQCDPNEEVIRECSATMNGKCGQCNTGYFRNKRTLACEFCSWCYPDYPSIGVFVSECDKPGVLDGFECEPVESAPYSPPQRTEAGVRGYEEMKKRNIAATASTPTRKNNEGGWRKIFHPWGVLDTIYVTVSSALAIITICAVVGFVKYFYKVRDLKKKLKHQNDIEMKVVPEQLDLLENAQSSRIEDDIEGDMENVTENASMIN